VPRKPRYIALAAILRKRISNGRYKIGDQLPTEHQLCEKHKVSRHTARAALQVLEDEALIKRKPGLGTTVIATSSTSVFAQPLGGIEDLLQYAHEAQLKVTNSGSITLTVQQSQRLGANENSKWLHLAGIRLVEQKSSSIIGAKPQDFRNSDKSITEHIENKYGVSVAFITQSIKAEALSESDALILNAPAGQPVLHTVRRYFDAADRMFVVSDTRHPSDRFVYEMIYRRNNEFK